MTAEIEFVGHMKAVEVRPGDTLVVSIKGRLCHEQRQWLSGYVKGQCPQAAGIVVLDGGDELGVLRGGEQA